MSNRARVEKTIHVGTYVANFLQKTKRNLRAIELCKECLVLLNNLALDTEDHFTKTYNCNIYMVMFNVYNAIKNGKNAEKCARKILLMIKALQNTEQEGILRLELAHICYGQRRFLVAARILESAIKIMKEIGNREMEAKGYHMLGLVFQSLCEYQRANENYAKALAINMEIGDRAQVATIYGNIGTVLQSLGECHGAKEYQEKALAIDMEIGDRAGVAADYGNLGTVLQSLGEYHKAKEYLDKALAINMEIGNRAEVAVNYGNLGFVLKSNGEYHKAKEYYEKALAINMKIGDRAGVAENHRNLATVLQSLGEYHEANEYEEKALAIDMEIGNRAGVAVSYGKLGTMLQLLGEYHKAKEYLEKALAINMEIGNRVLVTANYGNLGVVSQSLSEYHKAKEYQEKALAINMEIGERVGVALNYGNLGIVLRLLGEYHKAKEYQEKALAINMEIGDRAGVAFNYGNLGIVLKSLGEYHKAKEYYEKALAINMEIGNRARVAVNYGNLGTVLQSLGECHKAKEYQEKALAIDMEIGDRARVALSYGNLGSVLNSNGEYHKAKEYYEKALAINMEIGDRAKVAINYENLGTMFQSLGEYQKAKEYLEKAIAISMEIGDRARIASNYSKLGNVLLSLGEYHNAKEYCEKALAIETEIGDRQGQLNGYLLLGAIFCYLRKYRDAKECGEKALSIAMEIGDRGGEANAHGLFGGVLSSLRDYQGAKECLEKKFAIITEIGGRGEEANCYYELGNVFQRLGQNDLAEEYLKKARLISNYIGDIRMEFHAINSLSLLKVLESKFQEAVSYLHQGIEKYEKLRHSLRGNEQFQVSLLESTGAFPYKMLSEILCLAEKNPQDALYVEELARARCLADSMARNFTLKSHISSDPASWFGVQGILSKEHNSTFLYISYEDRQVLLWVLKTNGDILFRISEAVDDKSLIAEDAFNLDSFFKKSLHRFGILPNYKCEDRSLSETTLTSPYDESEADLRGEEAQDTIRRLQLCSKVIISPVADLLTEPEIIIIPERSLYRVPFAALRHQPGGKCLAETFRIRIVPSLTILKLIQDCPAEYHSQTGALVVGDPKVGRARYRGEIHNFTSLDGARKEAEMIGQLLGVQPLLGERATREAVLQAMNSVSLIHIAAHGNPDRGEIALSPSPTANSIPEEEDYLLRVSDISQVKLRAKLVILSCCHSGRGEIKVEGVLGIARAFLASGARSVLVTLWAIEDEATEQFITRFYRHLVDGFSASECLHQAMKWLRNNGFAKVSQWAPFMLIGDNVTFDFKSLKR